MSAAAQARIVRLEAENEDLRARVSELEGLAFGGWTAPVEWALTAAQARIFGFLLSRELASREQIAVALWSARPDCEIPGSRTVDVQICWMRRKLAPFGVTIRTVRGRGFALDPRERQRLAAAAPERRRA